MSAVYCFNCGDYLGDHKTYYGEIETCGKAECEREAREAERARDDEARARAEADGYERYR